MQDPPPGIDARNVTAWMAKHVPGANAGALMFEIVGDGRSNLTYRVSNGAQAWALRRPPLGHRVETAHDMAREFRVLSAVTGVGYPAPRPIALCTDAEVNELPFYVMEYVDGSILVDRLPEGFAPTPEARRLLSAEFAATLARLHAVDYRAAGLEDFGRPDGYLERQVRRWAAQWEANKTRDLPAIEELRKRLERALPPPATASIVHGDYRLGNIIFDSQAPFALRALLDVEMSTLGDPLADHGDTLCYWRGPGDTAPRPALMDYYAGATAYEGFFTRDELIAEYGRRSGRDVSHIDFYEIFACYKLAVITEGIHRRVLEGKQLGTGLEAYATASVELSAYALERAAKSEHPALRGAWEQLA